MNYKEYNKFTETYQNIYLNENAVDEGFPATPGARLNPWESPVTGKPLTKVDTNTGKDVKPTGEPSPGRYLNPSFRGVQKKTKPSSLSVASSAVKKTSSLQVAHFDIFDAIKGYLLDEGYAATEEAAIAIMANMSEEWRDSILEAAQQRF